MGTVNRSMAAISSLWLRKKAIHRFSWSGPAGRRGRYRDTVISEMMKPSLVSSAWMRGACAFYLFIRVMEITDTLSQNVPLEDVQYLAGHSNPSGHTDL